MHNLWNYFFDHAKNNRLKIFTEKKKLNYFIEVSYFVEFSHLAGWNVLRKETVGRGSLKKNPLSKYYLQISLCHSGDNCSSLFAPSIIRWTCWMKPFHLYFSDQCWRNPGAAEQPASAVSAPATGSVLKDVPWGSQRERHPEEPHLFSKKQCLPWSKGGWAHPEPRWCCQQLWLRSGSLFRRRRLVRQVLALTHRKQVGPDRV